MLSGCSLEYLRRTVLQLLLNDLLIVVQESIYFKPWSNWTFNLFLAGKEKKLGNENKILTNK